MAESDLPEATALALAGTTDTDTDFDYYTEFENYVLKEHRNNYRLLTILKAVNELRVFKDGDLTFGVRAGNYMDGPTERNYAGASAQALTDDDTNYIFLEADGTLTVNITGFPAAGTTPHIPLATILCASGEYAASDITDYRGRALFQCITALTPVQANEASTFFAGADTSVEAVTDGVGSPNVLTASESRKVITNEGATAKAYNTLPTAAAGLRFTFYVDDDDGLRVTAAAADTIRIGDQISIAAGYAESTVIGSFLTLIAINATEWVAIGSAGTWDLETS